MPPEMHLGPWSYRVRPVQIFLVECRFVDERPQQEEVSFPEDAEFEFGLTLTRPAPLFLGVGLYFRTLANCPVHVSITYMVEYEMHESVPEAERDDEFRHVAYIVAPPLLYTYVREMFSNLTSRWRGGAVPLPLLPLPLQYAAEDQIIPPPPADSSYQRELALAAPTRGGELNIEQASATH